MSQWIERTRNHVVWQNLTALGPALDQAVEREDLDPQTLDAIERVRTVLAFTGKRLASLDPALVQATALDGLGNSIQNVLSEVQSFVANGNPGHLSNANNHADSALAHLAQLVTSPSPDELQSLGETASKYRSSLERQLASARAAVLSSLSDLESLRQRLAELTTEVSTERQRVSSLGSDFQSQFSTGQDTRSREFTEAQSTRQDRFSSLLNEHTEKLVQQIAEFTRSREAAQKQFDDDIEELRTSYSKTAQGILDQVDQHRRDVEKLVGVIGNLGVTSGYLTTANQARRTLWLWQGVTVLALAGLIFVAWKAFLPTMEGTFSWQSFAGRALLSLTVGVLAAYAANQADKSQVSERRNRKLALELEALGPYLTALPPEKQQEFRLHIGEKSFGRDDSDLGSGIDRSPATVLDILKSKELREFITDIVKAAK